MSSTSDEFLEIDIAKAFPILLFLTIESFSKSFIDLETVITGTSVALAMSRIAKSSCGFLNRKASTSIRPLLPRVWKISNCLRVKSWYCVVIAFDIVPP